MIDGNMTTESNSEFLGFDEWRLGHIVRKYFYEIPPRLPCLPAPVPTEGGAGRLFQREEKLCPPLEKGG